MVESDIRHHKPNQANGHERCALCNHCLLKCAQRAIYLERWRGEAKFLQRGQHSTVSTPDSNMTIVFHQWLAQ